VANSSSIQIGQADNFSWIKIFGKGDVFLAPTVKKYSEKILELGDQTQLVLDLEQCTGMDSTFMGMIAGLAIKHKSSFKSNLHLFCVSEKNCESLEELGIDALLEINSQNNELYCSCSKVKPKLKEWSPEDGTKKPDARLILDTHKTLGSLSDSNQEEFSSVIKTFEQQLNE